MTLLRACDLRLFLFIKDCISSVNVTYQKMLSSRSASISRGAGALVTKSRAPACPPDIIQKAATNLPGIPHRNRVARLYRQWLKLAVLFPRSEFAAINEHAQMNERVMVIVRQKFREGASERDPEKIRALVHGCERNLSMFREIAADGAKRKFVETKPRMSLEKVGFLEIGKANYKQMAKEYWNTYFGRKW